MYELDAIAIGTGPSFYEWLKTPPPEGVKFYGSGVSSRYIKLDVYAIGDPCHIPNIPKYDAVIYVTDWMLSHSDKTFPYDGDTYPHGGSSGGMAISLACLYNDRIGIVGYDGPCGILDLEEKDMFPFTEYTVKFVICLAIGSFLLLTPIWVGCKLTHLMLRRDIRRGSENMSR
jgi:hypothetical protein